MLALSLENQGADDCAIILARRKNSWSVVVMGNLDHPSLKNISFHLAHVAITVSRLSFACWKQIQLRCESLAKTLLKEIGYLEIKNADFAPIPSGGYVTLGLLASLLALEHSQIDRYVSRAPDSNSNSLLIIVDDCALTGARFAEQLEKYPNKRIVFAHLYSPAPLRQAILEQEPRVEACLAAEDLKVFSTLPEGHPYPDSRKRYWLGSTETLCFPWNEPDRMLYDSETESWQKAWPIVPPELCLKNRLPPGVEPLPVQIQPEARGPLKPTERVVFGDLDEKIVLADLESSQCFALTDSAAAMWRAMIEHGELDGIVAAVADEYDAPRDVLRRDAEEFLDELRQRGLVEG